MGVSLEAWRQRIGCFGLCHRAHKVKWVVATLTPPRGTGTCLRLAMLLLGLLIVAGDVESNPGPNEIREYTEKTESFSTQEVLDILHNPDWNRVIREPPVKPRAGQVFLYHFTEDSKKDDWRCDQYHFHHDGTRKQPKKHPKFNKLFFVIKTSQGKDNRFKKHAYILLEGTANLVLFQYIGDDSVAEDLPHGNSKNPNSAYTRLCPSLLRAIKSISLKPTDALRLLYSEAEGCSVPEVFRPRSLIHIINTKYRGKNKAKETGDPTSGENLQMEQQTAISTEVPEEKGKRKRRNATKTGCEPKLKRICSRTHDGQIRKELEAGSIQTVCPNTRQNICPHIPDAGNLNSDVAEKMSTRYHTTSTSQESSEAQTVMDTSKETVVSPTQSPAGPNGISSGLSNHHSSSDTSTESPSSLDTSTLIFDSSIDVPQGNETQSCPATGTYHIPTTESAYVSTRNKLPVKVEDQNITSSSSPTHNTLQYTNSDAAKHSCIIIQKGQEVIQTESGNVPVMICKYNFQQESKCSSNDTNRQDTIPLVPQICDPLQQQLGISSELMTETIKIFSSIVHNPHHFIRGTEGQFHTIPVVVCDEQHVTEAQSIACDPLPAVNILPQTASSLINQTRQLWFSEFMRVRQVLTQSELVRMTLQSEIQTNDSFLILLTAIVVGAQMTRSNVVGFLETLKDPPGHLQSINYADSEVRASVEYNIGSYRVTGRDINRLSGTSWLDDNVIHAYLWVLQEQVSETEKTFVFPCFLEQKWEESNYTVWHYEQQKLKDYTWILLPVCRNSHWFLLVANVRNKTVGVINSSSFVSAVTKNRILAHWRTYMNRRSEVTGENLTEWREESYPIFPQTDGSSCGVYVLMAADALLSGVSPAIMRNCHVTGYRKYVSQRLMAEATPVCTTQSLDHDTDDVMVVEVEEEQEISIVEKKNQDKAEENNIELDSKQRTDYEDDTRKLCSENGYEDTDVMYNFLNASDTEIRPQDYKTSEPVQSTDHDLDVLTERDITQNVRKDCRLDGNTEYDLVDTTWHDRSVDVKSCNSNSLTNKKHSLQEDRIVMLSETKRSIENLYQNNKTGFTALILLCLLNGNVTLSEFKNSISDSSLHRYLKWSCELSGLLDSRMEDIQRELINSNRFIQITDNNVVKLRDPEIQRLIYAAVSDHAADFVFQTDLMFIYHFVRIENQTPYSNILVTNNNIKALASRFAKEILQGNIALTVSHDACGYYHFNILLRKALLDELENENLEQILQFSDNYFGESFIHWLCFAKNAELFKCLSGILTDDHKLNSVIPCCVSGNVNILKLLCTELDKEQVLGVSKCNQKLPTILVNMNIHEVSVELFETHSLPPVHLACYWSHCDIVECLLDHGLDVNEQLNKGIEDCESIPEGSTPACIAAARGHTDVIKCLIDHKADLNLHDTNYNTPLHHACRDGHWNMVGMMVQHCNLSERNTQGDTPLHIACQTGDVEGVKILMRNGSDYNLLNYQNYTPLDIACKEGSLSAVEYMINTHGYPLPYDGSNTPLHKACRGGFTEVVQLLLKHNAGRSVTFDEHHPLFVAVSDNFQQITKLLLGNCSLGMSLAKDRDGNYPLTVACNRRHVEIVKLLLEKGADVSGTDDYSPLTGACENGHVEIVKLLLEKGADMSVTDDYSPLTGACRNGHVEIVKLLLEKGADVSVTDYDYYSPLTDACKNGHAEIVKLLLEKGADVSGTDDYDGYSLLEIACRNGHAEIVKLLLENSADVSVTDFDYYSPLTDACKNGHVEIVKLLLENGADVSVTDDEGFSPLENACENGHVEIVKLLLENGADVSVTDDYSPLACACRNGPVEIVKLLLENGADVSVTDFDYYSPLTGVCRNGDVEIVKLLLENGADVSATDYEGFSPLENACENGHAEIVKLLLEKGADVSVTDYYSLLTGACRNGHVEIVKLLLEKGADVSVTDYVGFSPLENACENGHAEIVKLLLEKGADVSVTDYYSPLTGACRNGHVEIVKLLLEKGADVSVTDYVGFSPLENACENEHVEIVKLLLENGADVSVTDDYSPLTGACRNGHVEIVKLLLEKGADVSVTDDYSPLTGACRNGHVEIVKLLLEKGADVSVTDRRGYCPLRTACENGHVKIVKLLCEKGAVVSVNAMDGYSPLFTACRNGHEKIAKLLLEKGADLSATDRWGYCPLRIACENGHVEIVKLLLEKGADVSATDRWGYCPLRIACENGHVEIVKLLLEKGAVVSLNDKDSYSPLIDACMNGHVQIVKLLLEKCSDVSVTDRQGYSLMRTACAQGFLAIVELLLDGGADEGKAPLSAACRRGHVEIMKLLLKKGVADVILKLLLEKSDCFSVTDRCDSTCGNKSKHSDEYFHRVLKHLITVGGGHMWRILMDHFVLSKQNEQSLHEILLMSLEKRKYFVFQMLFNVCKCGDIKAVVPEAYRHGSPYILKTLSGSEQTSTSLQTCNLQTINLNVECLDTLMNRDNIDFSPGSISEMLRWACVLGDHDTVKQCLQKQTETVEKLTSMFFLACNYGYIVIAKELLKSGADVNYKCDDGTVPLHIACKRGVKEIAILLLKAGCNVNQRDKYGRTALYMACNYMHRDIVRLLLTSGAQVASPGGPSPLHLVCKKGDTDMADMLLNACADIEHRDEHGRAALCLACCYMQHDIIRLLLKKDAQITCPEGPSPLFLVCKMNNSMALQTMLEYKSSVMEDLDTDGNSPLHISVQYVSILAVKLLLEYGANVNCTNKKGQTLLHIAFEGGNGDIIKILLQHTTLIFRRNNDMEMPITKLYKNQSIFRLVCDNIPPECLSDADDNGNTLLHHACINAFHDCVLSLLHRSYDKTCVNKQKETALHSAVEKGCQKSVSALLQFGFDCNSINKESQTPLHIACQEGFVEIVQMLLRCNSQINTKDVMSRTPLHYAAKCGYPEIVQMLINKESNAELEDLNGDKPLHLACDSGRTDTVEILVQHTSDINASGHKGRTPLHRAVARGNIKIVKFFLENGAQALQNRFNNTPLYTACLEGHLEIMKLLLKHSDMLEITGINGYFYVVICCIRQHLHILRYLIVHGAAISPKGISCPTPLSVASLSDILGDEEKDIEKSVVTGLEGLTPLDVALDENLLHFVEYLLSEGVARSVDVCEKDNQESILIKICEKGTSQIAKLFLDSGTITDSEMMQIITNECNLSNNASLQCKRKNTDDNECIIQQEQDEVVVIEEDDVATENHSPILTACMAGHNSIASLLIAFASGHLKDMRERNVYEKQSPLHLTYDFQLMEMVSYLISNNVDITMTDKNGYTIFHKACICGDIKIVDIVCNAVTKAPGTCIGEKILHDVFEIVNKRETTNVIVLACKSGYRSLASLLIAFASGHLKVMSESHLYEHQSPLHLAYELRMMNVVLNLISENIDITVTDANGYTVFHKAYECGDFMILYSLCKGFTKASEMRVGEEFLLNVLEVVNKGENATKTADLIVLACKSIHRSLACLLIVFASGHLQVINESHLYEHQSPLHLAYDLRMMNVVSYLISEDIDITVIDAYGYTVFHKACEFGDRETMKHLFRTKREHSDTMHALWHAVTEDGEMLLHIAVRKGHVHLLKFFLQNDLDMTTNSSEGNNAMHIACSYDKHKVCQILLYHVPILAVACNVNGYTPFDLAIRRGNISCLKAFMRHQDDQFAGFIQNLVKGYMHRTMHTHDLQLLRLLVRSVPLLQLKDKNSDTIFHMCARLGNSVVMKYFAKKISNSFTEIANQTGDTPLHVAVWHGKTDIVNILIPISYIDAKNNHGDTPLHFAAFKSHAEIVELLLASGADDTVTNLYGDTPLHAAACAGVDTSSNETECVRCIYDIPPQRTIPTIKILLNDDALVRNVKNTKTEGKVGCLDQNSEWRDHTSHNKLSAVNSKGKSPLHLASEHGHYWVAGTILEFMRQSDLAGLMNIQETETGFTPLHLASHGKRDRIVSLLLEHGADTTVRDREGNMPVILACEAGHAAVLKLLLPYTNLVNDLDNTGGTLLHVVCRIGREDLLNMILEHIQSANLNLNLNSQNSDDIISGDIHFILNKIDNERQTALHVSCKYGNYDCVQGLLNHRLKLNVSDSYGRTALHHACRSGCVTSVSLLLQHDTCLSPSDIFGMTPLHYACLTGSEEIAHKLLKAGADLHIRDMNGSTPLDMCSQDHKEVLTRRRRSKIKRHCSSPETTSSVAKKSRADFEK